MKRIVVMGGGPAGVEAALAAAPCAQSVHIITDGPVGNWHKLMPSRVWMTALEEIPSAAGDYVSGRFDLKAIAERVDQVAQSWNAHRAAELEGQGVSILTGRASFAAPNQIQVQQTDERSRIIAADAVVIAAGSTPFFPPGLEPDSQRVWSPGTVGQMEALPQSMLVIGDGPPGFEFVEIFTRLGIPVTWVVLEGGPRCGFVPEADQFLLGSLQRRSLRIEAGKPLLDLQRHPDKVAAVKADGTRLEAEMAFVTVGHRPNLEPLRLAAAGLATNAQGLLQPDPYGRTQVPHIYIVGDAIRHAPGNFAMAQARVAARHATGQEVAPFEAGSTVVCFGLNPQVAQVGLLEAEDGTVKSISIPYKASILAHINGGLEGFLRLAWDRSGLVVGGLAIGRQATEALAPVGIAIQTKTSIDRLAQMQGPHPTVGELSYIAARQACQQMERTDR
ncbi:MAG: hypothetical protein GKR89_23715 [Candidatus Latescibacteria bacterium]|nr:hypothetical protein [Candidatus Latescibacterota bacterium]